MITLEIRRDFEKRTAESHFSIFAVNNYTALSTPVTRPLEQISSGKNRAAQHRIYATKSQKDSISLRFSYALLSGWNTLAGYYRDSRRENR